jgi:uncharacterized protein DUF3352
MASMRPFLALCAAAALLAAGCGSSEETRATTDSASLAPKDAAVYVSLDTDRGSAQWQQLEKLLQRVPGAQKALDGFLADALGEEGLDFDRDVEPALGPEVLLVLPAGSAGPVILTEPRSRDKLDALIAKGKQRAVTREINGWTAIAETDAALDGYAKALAQGALDESADFSQAMGGLPEDALARLYVRAEGLGGLLQRAIGSAGGIGRLVGTPSTTGLGTVALALAAEEHGVRLEGTVEQQGLPDSFAPKLLGRVPAGAFLAATFKGGTTLGEQLRAAAGGNDEAFRQFEQLLGVSLDDLVSLLEGEGVLYVRPNLPIPELTLAVEQTDPKQAQTLRSLLGRVAALANGQLSTAVEDGVSVTRVTIQGISLGYASVDGLNVVTTARAGIRSLLGSGPKLVAEPEFKAAAGDVGYDGSTSGFVYVDVDGIVPLVQGLIGLAGGSGSASVDQLVDALETVDSIALNATSEGERARFNGFVRLR